MAPGPARDSRRLLRTLVVLAAAAGLVTTAARGVRALSLPPPLDFDGDGRTDWVVTRVESGQLMWYIFNGAGFHAIHWGITGDEPVPGDYDGDGRTDVAVWRPSATAFFVLQSTDGSLRAQPWGTPGDDPTVVGDYDGDGRTDFAIYHQTVGSLNSWYVLGSQSGPLSPLPWGTGNDPPAPGDYDGDGKADYMTRHNLPGGQSQFYLYLSAGGPDPGVTWPTQGGVIVPGDYDGDGRTDVAVASKNNLDLDFRIHFSLGGTVTTTRWGLASTDFVVPGDYDGDGTTDLAVWRPSRVPGETAFYVLRSSDHTLQVFVWGMLGDYPVANFNVH